MAEIWGVLAIQQLTYVLGATLWEAQRQLQKASVSCGSFFQN